MEKKFRFVFFVFIIFILIFNSLIFSQTITITKYPAYIPSGSADTSSAPFAIYVVFTGGEPSTDYSVKVGDPGFTAIGNQLFTYRNRGTNVGTWGKTTSFNNDNFVFTTDAIGSWQGWIPVKSHRSGINQVAVRVRKFATGSTAYTSSSVNVNEIIAGTNGGYLVGNLLDGTGGSRENKIVIGYNGSELRGIWISEKNRVHDINPPISLLENNIHYAIAMAFVDSNGGYAMLVPNGINSITKIEVWTYPNNYGQTNCIQTELITGSLQNVSIPNAIPITGNSSTVGIASNITLNYGVPDGSGTATLVNDGVGILNGSTIFNRNSGSQVVKVTVTGISAGLLDRVRLTVPSDFTGFSGGNVTLGGAFAGKSTSIVGNQITILNAELGTTPGTISISGLTSPNPVGALLDGNSTWLVETAAPGGTLTPIAGTPVSHTIIPIQNLRTGGVDGYGNSDAAGEISAMNGKTVALQGIVTIENGKLTATTSTSFFIQSGGYGVQIFRSGSPATIFGRGDEIIVKGNVETFNGSTEVIPITTTSPNFFNLGAGTLPSPVLLTSASQINESKEGILIQLINATFDSAGQTFIASASNRGMNNFRTAPTDTGTLYLNAVNTDLVGKSIPTSANIIGIVYHRKDIIGAGQTVYKIASRDQLDLGLNPADGSGKAWIRPLYVTAGSPSITETITVVGDTLLTIAGLSVTLPYQWGWTGNASDVTLYGNGLATATKSVSGNGTLADPWVITIINASVTITDTGKIDISNLTAASDFGQYTFTVKTKGAVGTLAPIATQPYVTVIPTFPFVENFNYETGSLLTANGWTAHSGAGTNSIKVNADPLTYEGYIQSGVGKSVSLTTTGEDVNRPFILVNSGSVYASFMINVTSALTGGEYFFHLSPGGSPTTHTARIYFKKDASNNVAFGISKGSATALYTDFIYAMNTTYLIALKYTFNPGSNDDEIKLWVNPVLDNIEPTATLTVVESSISDPTSIGIVALRQGAGNATPALVLGGLRIDTTWIPAISGSLDIKMSAGWNMISVPLIVSDYRKSVLFPTATSNAFTFDNGYIPKDTLKNNLGYWLKFAVTQNVSMNGGPRTTDSVEVKQGWNMIGTLSVPIRTSQVAPSSGVTIMSQFYGYDNGYQTVDTLKPGKSYWVKVSAVGKLYLNNSLNYSKAENNKLDELQKLNSLTIKDANGAMQTLYFGSEGIIHTPVEYFELPPSAPEGIFDARFNSQRSVEIHSAELAKPELYGITITGAVYPVTVEWNVKNSNVIYEIAELVDGNQINQTTIKNSGFIRINNESVNTILLKAGSVDMLPKEFALSQNYPNPFNPTTKFTISVPSNADVKLVVYDILGREVVTLLESHMEAGYHIVEFSSNLEKSLTSGVYFIRMSAKSKDNNNFNFVRRITFLK